MSHSNVSTKYADIAVASRQMSSTTCPQHAARTYCCRRGIKTKSDR